MAAVDQLSGRTLPPQLLAQADRYQFVQLVRLLDRPRHGRAALGTGSDPAAEMLSFRAKVGFGFSPSDVSGAAPFGDRARVDVAFMSVAGNEGPLPPPYAEIVLQRARPADGDGPRSIAPGQPDDDARDFLDIFNHRLLSYFYRGRKKHSVALGAEAAGAVPLVDRMLYQLIGFNEGAAAGRLNYRPASRRAAPAWQGATRNARRRVDPRALLRYAGLLAARQRSMAGLATMLGDFLGAPVQGSAQQGRWLTIDPAFRTAIGPHGANRALGSEAVLGKRAWDARGKISLDIGPLPYARFQSLLPGGTAHAQLLFMVRFYLREDFDVDVVLTLAPDGPAARLPLLGQGRLARTAWLGRPAAGAVRSARFALGQWKGRIA